MTPRRVLIVDDSDLILKVVKSYLERAAGWDVVLASSGHEGLATAAEEQPDAILLDVVLPDLDGPEVFQELRAGASTQHIPVIFLTAMDEPADQERLAGLGAAAVIPKPFHPPSLAGQIAGALGWGA